MDTRERYGYLYKGYKLRSYYWETVLHERKILVAFISIFLTSQGTLVQSLVLLFLLGIFIYITLKIRPFEDRTANQLEVVSLLALIVTVYAGIFYLSASQRGTGFVSGKDCMIP